MVAEGGTLLELGGLGLDPECAGLPLRTAPLQSNRIALGVVGLGEEITQVYTQPGPSEFGVNFSAVGRENPPTEERHYLITPGVRRAVSAGKDIEPTPRNVSPTRRGRVHRPCNAKGQI